MLIQNSVHLWWMHMKPQAMNLFIWTSILFSRYHCFSAIYIRIWIYLMDSFALTFMEFPVRDCSHFFYKSRQAYSTDIQFLIFQFTHEEKELWIQENEKFYVKWVQCSMLYDQTSKIRLVLRRIFHFSEFTIFEFRHNKFRVNWG